MKLISKKYLPVLASALMLGMNMPASAEGNGSHYGYGQPSTVTNLSAALTAGTTAPTGFTGNGSFIFTYNSATGSGSLHASVNLPVDGSTIVDSNGAAGQTYVLTSSSGTSCTLSIQDIDFIYGSTSTTTTPVASMTEIAQYGFSVSVTGATTTTPVLTSAIGSCSKVAAPAVGDTISLAIPVASPVAGGPTTITLTGTLAALSHH